MFNFVDLDFFFLGSPSGDSGSDSEENSDPTDADGLAEGFGLNGDSILNSLLGFLGVFFRTERSSSESSSFSRSRNRLSGDEILLLFIFNLRGDNLVNPVGVRRGVEYASSGDPAGEVEFEEAFLRGVEVHDLIWFKRLSLKSSSNLAAILGWRGILRTSGCGRLNVDWYFSAAKKAQMWKRAISARLGKVGFF